MGHGWAAADERAFCEPGRRRDLLDWISQAEAGDGAAPFCHWLIDCAGPRPEPRRAGQEAGHDRP